jgi:hypothetical protein
MRGTRLAWHPHLKLHPDTRAGKNVIPHSPRWPFAVFALVGVVLPILFAPVHASSALTFQERVAAQEAIDRVYYGHQVGATRPFEEVVPREALERKVRDYLKESVLLEQAWSTRVTPQMLQRELKRIARDTRMPSRLQEIYLALGDDPRLVYECFVRLRRAL